MRIAGYDIVETLHESSETVLYRGMSGADTRPVILKSSKSEYPTPRGLARLQYEYGRPPRRGARPPRPAPRHRHVSDGQARAAGGSRPPPVRVRSPARAGSAGAAQ